MITLTAELVDTLEATIQGHQITPEYLHEICTRLFTNHQQFANISSGARNAPSAAELIARPGTAGQLLRQSIAAQPTEQDLLRFIRRVDFPKVKNALMNGQPRERASLLQALRYDDLHTPIHFRLSCLALVIALVPHEFFPVDVSQRAWLFSAQVFTEAD